MSNRKSKSKIVFAPVPGGVLNKTQAVVVGSELQRIERKHGAIKPQTVVDSARPTTSPIHEFFTWDDTVAAEEWRREEARHIVRSVRIIREEIPAAEQPVIRAFVAVKAHDDEPKFSGNGYVSFSRAQSVEFYREQVLASAKAELEQWARRYKDLKEFAPVYAAIDEVIGAAV